MDQLAQPFEIFEWKDGQTQEFTILRYEVGQLEIHPRDNRPPKTVPVMRIHVSPEDKPSFPSYWDLTSQRLVAQLKGLLPPNLYTPFKVKITAIGNPPATHFSVTRLPEVGG